MPLRTSSIPEQGKEHAQSLVAVQAALEPAPAASGTEPADKHHHSC